MEYFLDLQDSYTSDKIEKAFSKCRLAVQWTRIASPARASLVWREYEDIDWEAYHKHRETSSIINAYCIRKGLIRKSQNALLIDMYSKKRPNSVLKTGFPMTVLFTLDCLDYLDEALNECFEVRDGLARNQLVLDGVESGPLQVFMMKPSMLNRAGGLFVFRTMAEFEEHLEEIYQDDDDEERGSEREDQMRLSDCREWVIQEFVDRPLLVNSRKFHVRAYVLAVGAMDVYLYDDMLALFSTKPYEYLSQADDLAAFDPTVHITNTCVQSQHADFNEEEAVQRYWDFGAVGEFMDLKTAAFQQMGRILHDVFDAVVHSPTQFQPIATAFEMYGMDFLIDENWNVLFLEANAFPDFAQTGDKLGRVIEKLFEKTVETVITNLVQHDEYVPTEELGSGEFWQIYSRKTPEKMPFESQGR